MWRVVIYCSSCKFINIEIGKNRCFKNVRLAGDLQYGKLLFTWLSLVMSLMVSFCAAFFHEMSWMRSGIEMSQFLRVFLPTLTICSTSPWRYLPYKSDFYAIQ